MNTKEVKQLKEALREANKAYRQTANPIISDAEYDVKMDSLEAIISEEEFNDFLYVLKQDVIMGSERKEKHPHVMASLGHWGQETDSALPFRSRMPEDIP